LVLMNTYQSKDDGPLHQTVAVRFEFKNNGKAIAVEFTDQKLSAHAGSAAFWAWLHGVTVIENGRVQALAIFKPAALDCFWDSSASTMTIGDLIRLVEEHDAVVARDREHPGHRRPRFGEMIEAGGKFTVGELLCPHADLRFSRRSAPRPRRAVDPAVSCDGQADGRPLQSGMQVLLLSGKGAGVLP
jgi:hypothetical protein